MHKLFLSIILTISSLQADLLDFYTLKADFEQQVVNEQNKTISYSGTLYIMKPDKIVWQYKEPINKFIYMDSTEVTVYEPELYQAIIMKRNKELDPLKMYEVSKAVSKTLRVSEFDGKEIFIEHDEKRVKSLKFNDQIDNRVTITFTTYEKNLSIPKDAFSFKPTDDIDIIRQ